jgi:hypothetical protein
MEPCGRPSCDAPFDFSPRETPKAAASPEKLERIDPEIIAALARLDAQSTQATAHHESGHVLCAVAMGRGVEYARLDAATPHVAYGQGRVTEEAAVACSLAGGIAEGIAKRCVIAPSRGEIEHFLAKARAGVAGSCDRCTAARVLLVADREADDDELVARWIAYWRKTADLFDTIEARCALSRLVAALQSKGFLSGADVEALVDSNTLREAREALN